MYIRVPYHGPAPRLRVSSCSGGCPGACSHTPDQSGNSMSPQTEPCAGNAQSDKRLHGEKVGGKKVLLCYRHGIYFLQLVHTHNLSVFITSLLLSKVTYMFIRLSSFHKVGTQGSSIQLQRYAPLGTKTLEDYLVNTMDICAASTDSFTPWLLQGCCVHIISMIPSPAPITSPRRTNYKHDHTI